MFTISLETVDIHSEEFHRFIGEALTRARRETLASGVPVFYLDDGLNVMEQPDGRKFEIRWIPGAPAAENYEIVREVAARAA